MPYQLFHDLFPDLAERETRTITVPTEPHLPLPAGEYAFLEMFCNEPRCDCRRVFFYVVSSQRKGLETVIAWGWEAPEFYARWMGDDDPNVAADLKGPTLNVGSAHTARAPAILGMVQDILLQDEAYVERINATMRCSVPGSTPRKRGDAQYGELERRVEREDGEEHSG